MSNLELNFEDESARPGWRLHRLELLNWGTFGGARVHVIEPEGGWSLLVGENGSGKSTAVDAIRTLLVPRALLRGSFNDAAGGQGKRDRTLASYIRGQWSSSRENEADNTAPEFLRGENVMSIILAVFSNARRAAKITLAQLLWVENGKDISHFLVSPEEKGIAANLQHLGSGRELKRQLRERGFESYDGYAGYFRDFGKRMGMPEQSAMEIFNQAIGIKEVTSVNDFLRKHLLTRGDALDRIKEKIIPSFSNLEQCWESIQRDKTQIELLDPVVTAHHDAETASNRKLEIEQLAERLPAHYARKHRELLQARLAELEEELNRLNADLKGIEEGIETAQKSRDGAKSALDQDQTSIRIKEIELAIKEINLAINTRKKTREDFVFVASSQQLGELENEASFQNIRLNAQTRRETCEKEGATARGEAETAGVQARGIEQDLRKTRTELDGLRNRRVLIPEDFLNVRQLVCQQTGLAESDLPFAGELIEVKPERADWTGAIEKLLHAFGVSMLVPEAHYQKVAPLVNRLRLRDASGKKGLRFLFHRVPARSTEGQSPIKADTVPACLNYQREHPLASWVENEIKRSFHHDCCRDTVELENHPFGLTMAGLIRSGTRHVKDDRQAVDDPSNYVLGWSPLRKIGALEKKVDSLTSEFSRQREEERAARTREDQAKRSFNQLSDLLEIASYSDLDIDESTRELERLQTNKQELEQASEIRKKLQDQFDTADTKLKTLNSERDTKRDQVKEAEHQQKQHTSKLNEVKNRLDEEAPPLSEEQAGELNKLEESQPLTLENVEALENKIRNSLGGQANHQQRLINKARETMGGPMRKFLDAYPEEDKDLKAEPDYSADFVRIHKRLKDDDLPRHEENFRDFLNDNLTQHVGGLDAALREEVKAHQRKLNLVNAALLKLDYSGTTYVEIDHRETRDATIREFKGQLRDILGTGMNLDEHGRLVLFDKIRKLIARFRAEHDWTRTIADSRNWLDFGIREIRKNDGAQANYFDSSQGKSGGQKAKLAFTILAASLHAQYGLSEDENRTDTFRLVIIDEIFARTDEPNSKRALQLFQSMGFQLVLAAPWEAKVRIAEPFVHSYHLALNPDNDASSVRRATRAAYDTARDLALSKTTEPTSDHVQP